jgi:hypothetical protein
MKYLLLLTLVFAVTTIHATVVSSKKSEAEQRILNLKLKMDSGVPVVLNNEANKVFMPDGVLYEVVYICKHLQKEKADKCTLTKVGIK